MGPTHQAPTQWAPRVSRTRSAARPPPSVASSLLRLPRHPSSSSPFFFSLHLLRLRLGLAAAAFLFARSLPLSRLAIHGEPAVVVHPDAPRLARAKLRLFLPDARAGGTGESSRRAAALILLLGASYITPLFRWFNICTMDSLRDMVLPPGFGFHPKDTELIFHYLKKKIHGQKIEYEIIPEVDIYKHEPWDLPAKCDVPTQDNKWHFFAARDRKYPNGSRSNRATVAGYWKSTGKDRAIKMDKRTIGTKKTLVFHEGRPPTGRRTEWIMHEYYIDERECQACPDMKDAFVLCRVTKRNDWISGNGNELDNSDPHPEPIDAAPSVVAPIVGAEQLNGEATPVIVAEPPDGVTTSTITADIPSPSDGINLDEWLNELFDPFFDPEQSLASADLSPDEQNVESSNAGALAPKVEQDYSPKVEQDYSSPNENIEDDTEYLLTEDEELWSPQANTEPSQANEAADNGITRRYRHVKTPETSALQYKGKTLAKMQVGINKMATSSSESINQTIKFENNSGRLVEHQKNQTHDVASTKRSDAGKPSTELSSNRGFLRGIRNAFAGCSDARWNIILVAVFAIGVAMVALHVGQRLGLSQRDQQHA
uniref:NAC domain-containing protein n=1 Tax=Oryza punctata TaxID=4537 RepID=A0A0E0JGN3_ORYPU